ncbi:uncharacterized protein LOC111195371 isoform X1 [Astyanax mexicanus]|uniref:uncharacterized protein LOC111195371 isoform X1 n=1 Tax=Astyanax mexicanus TaxID=7994 RepID=UPI0020CAEB83|nr:uncharacterized protein LOC111195371 isoform X1 [Astyanax mexicanus]
MQKKIILPRAMKCNSCKKKMKLHKRFQGDGYQWCCTRNAHHHTDITASVRKGSMFFRSRLSLRQHLEFIYRFSQGLRQRQMELIEDGIAGSSRTLTKMTSALRKVCISAMTKLRQRGGMRVGGPHHFVMIDESKFSHKRKYNRGRVGSTWRRSKKWVLGILEVGVTTRKPILKIVSKRSSAQMLPVVRHYVRRGTSIITDEWRAYRGLSDLGYDHHTVCHKRHFVHPLTRAHTQHLERAWQKFKVDVWRHRANRNTKLLKQYLKIIEWEHWLAKKHKWGILGRLLHDIRKMYKSHS